MLVASSLLLTPAPASAAKTAIEQLDLATDFYFEGHTKRALTITERVLLREYISVDERIRALELKAFCQFVLGDLPAAETTWIEVLALDPEHFVDPSALSPEFVTFFSRLEPPPEQPLETDEASDSEAITAAAPEENPAAVELKPLAPPLEPERGCGILLCLVPGGVGQFANDQLIKGVLFAFAEVALLSTNIALYWAQPSDQLQDSTLLELQRETFISLLITTAVGIADAFLFP